MLPDYVVDSLWLLPAVPAVLLMIYARARVLRAFAHYRQVPSRCRLRGSQVARLLLDSIGLRHVPVEEIDGELTDHYDQRHRALRLSSHAVHEASVAALGIAVHEVGHAIQHHARRRRFHLRAWVVPIVVYAPLPGLLLILASVVLQTSEPGWLGALLLFVAASVALLVLPVEREASRLGLQTLRASGLVGPADQADVEAVLSVAPLTYLALLLAVVGQLLYLGLAATGITRRQG